MSYRVGLIGKGFVGNAIFTVLTEKGLDVKAYDKYKQVGKPEDVLDTDMVFLCLPTPFIENYGYDISSTIETCQYLVEKKYDGLIILKSTIEPGTTRKLYERFGLRFCHNPEFLTERTAIEDFRNQHHIVLGTREMGSKDDIILYSMYRDLWSEAKISCITWEESEMMKIAANSFYSLKIGYFNEIYFLCQRIGADYKKVRDAIVSNGWCVEQHTHVPGPDGQYYFGGHCLVKDPSALNLLMERSGTPHEILESCIKERHKMRKD